MSQLEDIETGHIYEDEKTTYSSNDYYKWVSFIENTS